MAQQRSRNGHSQSASLFLSLEHDCPQAPRECEFEFGPSGLSPARIARAHFGFILQIERHQGNTSHSLAFVPRNIAVRCTRIGRRAQLEWHHKSSAVPVPVSVSLLQARHHFSLPSSCASPPLAARSSSHYCNHPLKMQSRQPDLSWSICTPSSEWEQQHHQYQHHCGCRGFGCSSALLLAIKSTERAQLVVQFVLHRHHHHRRSGQNQIPTVLSRRAR